MWAEWFLDLEKAIRQRKLQILELDSTYVH